MLINMKELLTVAKDNKFAVGAFNISDANMFRAVVDTAEELNSPAIIAIHPDELSFISPEFVTYIKERVTKSKVPFVIHLDHGGSFEDVTLAIRSGFTSVMIDGSLLPYEENISVTQKVVELARPLNISVEGELGTIGNIGNSFEGGVSEIIFTQPEEAIDFVNRTGVDTLAVAIGTAHGIYPKDFVPQLRLEILEEIVKNVETPIVLHGGSSNPDEEISKAVKIGVQKINISSDMKKAYMEKAQELLSESLIYEPNTLFPPCVEAAKQIIREKMKLFNSVGKTELYYK